LAYDNHEHGYDLQRVDVFYRLTATSAANRSPPSFTESEPMMESINNTINACANAKVTKAREPWNKGKLIGQKAPSK
jgi:hypothetical protein